MLGSLRVDVARACAFLLLQLVKLREHHFLILNVPAGRDGLRGSAMVRELMSRWSVIIISRYVIATSLHRVHQSGRVGFVPPQVRVRREARLC